MTQSGHSTGNVGDYPDRIKFKRFALAWSFIWKIAPDKVV